MKEHLKNNNKRLVLIVLLIVVFVCAFLVIRRAVDHQTMGAEMRIENMVREKKALLQQIEYLDEILRGLSLEYTLLFDGTEDELRGSMLSGEAAGMEGEILPHEATEIIGILDEHINEPVNFSLKGDDYLLAVYKDLIGGEVRDHVKYILNNAGSIDIYCEREILPFRPDTGAANRLIYHWVKVLKIPGKTLGEHGVHFHIID